ncbi:hypothetical protein FACS189483_11320 [Spirochaetia bacterium]|nr:hypothetical protein FACS189483_11320 [Spirochaetia bacterium]
MIAMDEWFCADDGTKLFLRRWLRDPGVKPRGVLHVVHGMAEHSLRYERLARRLCEAGFEVWAADQRGHGKTADPAVNEGGHGGLLGYCGDQEWLPVQDIIAINRKIKEVHGDLPLFLLGHSWGSFLVQNVIEVNSQGLAGCILSGTRGPDGFKITAGAPAMALIAAIKGKRRPSRLAWAIANGPYNKPFKPNRTRFDWLSRDEKEVDAFDLCRSAWMGTDASRRGALATGPGGSGVGATGGGSGNGYRGLRWGEPQILYPAGNHPLEF